MYILENEILKISINPVGAELYSIFNKVKKVEHLWQGDPSIWVSRAPVLFPIIGGLKNGTYFYNEKAYQLPRHGFIRHNEDLVAESFSNTQISFLLSDSYQTRKVYPFYFKFKITFELIENKLKITHQIQNTGSSTMFFSVGGHPAFNCPLHTDEAYTDYYIQLQNGADTQSHILTKDGLISNHTLSVMENAIIKLTPTLFNQDALIFKNIHAEKAILSHVTKGPILAVDFQDFPDLGIWAKPQAPYVCIEPWLGYADLENTDQNLKTKEGIHKLKPKKVHESNYQICIY